MFTVPDLPTFRTNDNNFDQTDRTAEIWTFAPAIVDMIEETMILAIGALSVPAATPEERFAAAYEIVRILGQHAFVEGWLASGGDHPS